METFALLQLLTETPGPSGNEDAIATVTADLWRALSDEVRFDRVGSVLAIKRGNTPRESDQSRPTLLLAAHADELGLIVSQVVDHQGNGFLRVSELGGVDWRQLFGQTVVVHGREPLTGVLGALPDTMLPPKERDKAYSYESLVVDIGLDAQRTRELISVGDFVTFRRPLRRLSSGVVSGKALDNRASVAAVTICLEQLQHRQHVWDVLAVATSQEETAFLGAYTTAFAVRPDAAVAIDVTHAKGPGTSEGEHAELGGGPVLGVGANVHPGMYRALRDTAKAIEMTVGNQAHAAGSGTDAYAIQVSRAGIPTGLVSIPLRYMHTMVETVDMADVERTGRLLAELIARLDEHFLDNLQEELMRRDSDE